jgi:hypothetical protein
MKNASIAEYKNCGGVGGYKSGPGPGYRRSKYQFMKKIMCDTRS